MFRKSDAVRLSKLTLIKYLARNKCEFWQTGPDAVQGGECAAVRALQAGANAATRRFWQPKTHLFMGKYLSLGLWREWQGRVTHYIYE
jgi:hypothetical protein